jgi:F0F1-type ATP synthase assembly protein I
VEELTARRDLHQGFGNAMSQAAELVGAPLIFGFLGFLLDCWLGWTPVLMIIGAVYGIGGAALRMYYGYAAKMREHEAGMPWNRAKR